MQKLMSRVNPVYNRLKLKIKSIIVKIAENEKEIFDIFVDFKIKSLFFPPNHYPVSLIFNIKIFFSFTII